MTKAVTKITEIKDRTPSNIVLFHEQIILPAAVLNLIELDEDSVVLYNVTIFNKTLVKNI